MSHTMHVFQIYTLLVYIPLTPLADSICKSEKNTLAGLAPVWLSTFFSGNEAEILSTALRSSASFEFTL